MFKIFGCSGNFHRNHPWSAGFRSVTSFVDVFLRCFPKYPEKTFCQTPDNNGYLIFRNSSIFSVWRVYQTANLQPISYLVAIYLLKGNNRNTRTRCEICSKLIKQSNDAKRRSGAFIVNFEHISHLVLVFLLLTLNMWILGTHVREAYPGFSLVSKMEHFSR